MAFRHSGDTTLLAKAARSFALVSSLTFAFAALIFAIVSADFAKPLVVPATGAELKPPRLLAADMQEIQLFSLSISRCEGHCSR